jgi:hypothetical protein
MRVVERWGGLHTMRARFLDAVVAVGLLVLVVIPFAVMAWLVSRLV